MKIGYKVLFLFFPETPLSGIKLTTRNFANQDLVVPNHYIHTFSTKTLKRKTLNSYKIVLEIVQKNYVKTSKKCENNHFFH